MPENPDVAVPPAVDSKAARRLARFAHLLDSSIRLPGGFRIGWEGIIGLIPGIGDLIGLVLSSGIVIATARLGVPRMVLARMALNIALESLIGAIPLFGDLFDFVFKANERNLALAFRALESPVEVGRRSTGSLALVVLAALALVLLTGWAIVAIVAAVLGLVF